MHDWATPIVCVPNTDGSVRIFGDYKGTVNPAIQMEQFPIPTLEEIRGKVSTWNKFTKIDLRSAYQQLVLDEESQNCVRSTPTRVCSDIHVYHLEFHPVQPTGSVSLSKYSQDLAEHV